MTESNMAESSMTKSNMTESTNPLVAFSDHAGQLVERAAGRIVAVHGGGRRSTSGIHWRPGIIVTAEEALERDEDIKVTLPGGRLVEAALAGRDPTTDIAVLRFQPDGLAVAQTADAGSLRAGHVVLAVGNHQGGRSPVSASWRSRAGLGTASVAAPSTASSASTWCSSPVAEGGALVDTQGRVVGMAVLGPRRRVLAIPTATIDRVVDQLLAKGHVFRGYLGAGLQPVRLGRAAGEAQPAGSGRGILVVSLDPEGPAARAGLLVGDIVTAWNAQPVDRVREVMRSLGPDSVGQAVDLGLLRGGAAMTLKIVIGERAVA